MIMIPVLHILGQGGILSGTEPLSVHYTAAWLLETASYCSVNVYGLISGYAGYQKPHPLSRLLTLYFQVLFYTLLTTVLFSFYYPELINMKIVRASLFPFAYNVYWYFTAYFCLFFFMPYLDRLISRQNQSDSLKLILLIFLVFSVLPTIFRNDFGTTGSGYSFLWLALMYLTGAYIKKSHTGKREHRYWYLTGYLFCVLLAWILKILTEQFYYTVHQEYTASEYLISYISPIVVLSAVFLLLFFKELKIPFWIQKIISFFSPAAFDVYLLHEEPLIVKTFLIGAFAAYLNKTPLIMTGLVLGTAAAIWLTGSLAGRIRRGLFRIFRIERLSVFLAGKIETACRAAVEKISRTE